MATGILAVTDKCPKSDVPCCNLGFNTSAFSKKRPRVYTLMDFCRVKCYSPQAYCDTINGGIEWQVVQRRQNGSVDFHRDWGEYEDGFGNLTGEFWYGLRALHCLTGHGGWEMRIDVTSTNGTKILLQYEEFKVASAKDKYRMTYSGFQGTTTDPMVIHNEMNFPLKTCNDNDSHVRINYANSGFQGTTTDPLVIHNEMNFPLKTCNDNDSHVRINCAIVTSWGTTEGWSYKNCAKLQLDTIYDHTHAISLNDK